MGIRYIKFSPEVRWLWKHVGWGPPIGNIESYEDASVIERVYPDGTRESRPAKDKKADFNVAVVGCSYAFGLSVPAEKTFVWLLNEKYPDVCFDNYSVYGWGPLQIQAKTEQLLKSDKHYDLIVYPVILDHLYRLQPGRINGNLSVNGQYAVVPYVYKDLFGNWKVKYSDDTAWLGERCFLSVDWMKRIYYRLFVRYYQHPDDGPWKLDLNLRRKYSDFLVDFINKMEEQCAAAGSDFVLCGVDHYVNEWVLFDKNLRCRSVDIDKPDSEAAYNRVCGNKDWHPNDKVNAYWAEKFSEWFDKQYEKSIKNSNN